MGIIRTGVGSPGTVGPASGGKIYGVSLTTLVQVAPANPNRQSITFHNPGLIDILIGPAKIFTSGSATTQSAFTPTTSAYAGCFRVFANGGSLTVTGECQQAWQGLTSDASAGLLTVMDSNVG